MYIPFKEGYGAGTLGAQNGGVLVNSYASLYTTHGLDTRGDMIVATVVDNVATVVDNVATVVDKNAGRIYRVTFIVSNNSSNTTGYSILIERVINIMRFNKLKV